MKKIILNADDFGASKEINAGIKKAILKGRVTSVSVMVTRPYFTDAVHFLKKHPKVSIGLHFDLTEGKQYKGVLSLFALSLFDKYFSHYIHRELSNQYSKLKKTGLPISHIDSHEHIHSYPPIFKIVHNFAQRHKIQRVRSCPFSFTQLIIASQMLPAVKELFIWSLYGIDDFLFIRGRKKSTFSSSGLFDFNWRNTYSSTHISRVFSSFPKGTTEVICHLSSKKTHDMLSFERRECLSFILSKSFGRILKNYALM